MEGESPYQSMEFENRSSIIRNLDGSIVSEWEKVAVPKDWSQVATDIMAQKYFRKAGIPKHLKAAKERRKRRAGVFMIRREATRKCRIWW